MKNNQQTECLLSTGDEAMASLGRESNIRFGRGERQNAIAPFVSACPSIVLSYQERNRPYPTAILDLFDIARRYQIPQELRSFTVPSHMFKEKDDNAILGCLTTETWDKISSRI
jgi:hypothetical protein